MPKSSIALGATVAAALGLVACDDSGSPPPVKTGQLGNADFTYVCGPDTDPQCNSDSDLATPGELSSFPSIAVGGKFGMNVQSHEYPNTEMQIDVSDVFFDFDHDSRLITVKRPGVASVVGIDGSAALDLTWLDLVTPDHIKLIQATPDGKFQGGSVSIGPGGVTGQASVQVTYKFRAIAADKDDHLLAGALPCMWTTSDATIANITSSPTLNIATVVSGKAGTATIHVTLGALAADIAIVVS